MEAIKYYVKGAFVGIPETPEVLEQQEELIADLSAKVEDLAAEGKTEDEALGIAIASMGDLSALVREFAVEEPAVAASQPTEVPVPKVEVYASKLKLHTVTFSVVGAIVVLFVLSVLGLASMNGAGASAVAAVDIMLGVAGLVWIGYVLVKFHAEPNAIAVLELRWDLVKTALLQWAGVCAAAFFLNVLFGTYDFWAWTIWIGVLAWPATIYLQQRLVRSGKFLVAPASECVEEASGASTTTHDGTCAPSCS